MPFSFWQLVSMEPLEGTLRQTSSMPAKNLLGTDRPVLLSSGLRSPHRVTIDQLYDLLSQGICDHTITSRAQMHPTHQDISILIKYLLNIHKRHMVGNRPPLEIGREHTVC